MGLPNGGVQLAIAVDSDIQINRLSPEFFDSEKKKNVTNGDDCGERKTEQVDLDDSSVDDSSNSDGDGGSDEIEKREIHVDDEEKEESVVDTEGLGKNGNDGDGEVEQTVVFPPNPQLPKPEAPPGVLVVYTEQAEKTKSPPSIKRSNSTPESAVQIPAIGRFFREKSNSLSAAITKRLSLLAEDNDVVSDKHKVSTVTEFSLSGLKVTVKLKNDKADDEQFKGRITFFSRSNCRDSTAVRSHFRDRKLRYVEINIDVYPTREKELIERTGSSAVPQIFFNEKLFGGLVALNSLRNCGLLEERMKELLCRKCPDDAPAPPVYGFDDPEEEKTDDLVTAVRVLRQRLPIQDRLTKMKIVKNCFSAPEMIEIWIQQFDCGRKKKQQKTAASTSTGGRGRARARAPSPIPEPALLEDGFPAILRVNREHIFLNFENAPREGLARESESRKNKLSNKKVVVGRCVDLELLDALGRRADIESYLVRYHKDHDGNVRFLCRAWERALLINEPTYDELLLEFYSTIKFEPRVAMKNPEDPCIQYRVANQWVECNLIQFAINLGIYTVEETTPRSFHHYMKWCATNEVRNVDEYWRQIGVGDYRMAHTKESSIRSGTHRFLHRMIAYTIRHRNQGPEKVNKYDMWLLHQLIDKNAITNIPFVIAKFLSTQGKGLKGKSPMGAGHYVTRLARAATAIPHRVWESMTYRPMGSMDEVLLLGMHVIVKFGGDYVWNEHPGVEHPGSGSESSEDDGDDDVDMDDAPGPERPIAGQHFDQPGPTGPQFGHSGASGSGSGQSSFDPYFSYNQMVERMDAMQVDVAYVRSSNDHLQSNVQNHMQRSYYNQMRVGQQVSWQTDVANYNLYPNQFPRPPPFDHSNIPTWAPSYPAPPNYPDYDAWYRPYPPPQ